MKDIHQQAFAYLQSIQGDWQGTQNGRSIGEEWSKTSSNRLIGTGFFVSDTGRVVIEHTEFHLTDSGLFFIPDVPHNQGKVYFRLVSFDSSKAAFENLSHDFPTRVLYGPIENDSLHARIEGARNGKLEGFDFVYGRIGK